MLEENDYAHNLLNHVTCHLLLFRCVYLLAKSDILKISLLIISNVNDDVRINNCANTIILYLLRMFGNPSSKWMLATMKELIFGCVVWRLTLIVVCFGHHDANDVKHQLNVPVTTFPVRTMRY